MNETKANKTIDSLLKRTKAGSIQWERVGPQTLRSPFVEDAVDITDINYINSFQCEFKEGAIYVLSDDFTSSVFIQPRKNAALTSLPATSGKISQLKNVIKDDIDSIDDFLDELNGN